MLAALRRVLLIPRHASARVDANAALVNLTLERANKVRIVHAGRAAAHRANKSPKDKIVDSTCGNWRAYKGVDNNGGQWVQCKHANGGERLLVILTREREGAIASRPRAHEGRRLSKIFASNLSSTIAIADLLIVVVTSPDLKAVTMLNEAVDEIDTNLMYSGRDKARSRIA
uniref:Uncharacterized protein n=1 Tax=Oryza brachyantha TaxID=4533 RepID=J3LYK5_ORYBR